MKHINSRDRKLGTSRVNKADSIDYHYVCGPYSLQFHFIVGFLKCNANVHFHICNVCMHHSYTMQRCGAHIRTEKNDRSKFFLIMLMKWIHADAVGQYRRNGANENDNKRNIWTYTNAFLWAQFIFSHTDESDFNLFKVTPALVAIPCSFWWLRPWCVQFNYSRMNGRLNDQGKKRKAKRV